MSAPRAKPGFAARPGAADRWVEATDTSVPARAKAASIFTARLTIDVTPALRQRMKLAAVVRGITVADMLRTLLEQEYPKPTGDD